MYAKGMTTGDIEAHIQDIYGISVSDSTVSPHYRQNPAHSQGVAAATPGTHLRCGILDAIHYHVAAKDKS